MLRTVSRAGYALLEIATLGLFALSMRFTLRTHGRQRLVELLTAVGFGLLLEQGDIAIFGSYTYNPLFFLRIGAVPIAIALVWALVITSSMFMSDAIGVPPRIAPFSDAIFTILLDLSVDAIAIRQGLWHWNIPLDQGFFGVPAGNYYGWLFVAFGFSAWTRLVRRSHRRSAPWFQWLVPLPAYLTLLAAFVPFIVVQDSFFGGRGGGFPPLLLTLASFGSVTARQLMRSRGTLPSPWSLSLLPRLAVHLYFLATGVLLGVFERLPVLLGPALAMLILELSLHGTASRLRLHAAPVGEAPKRRTSLRSTLSIPGIVMVLVLSRTLNLCASALFASVTLLVSNPTVGLLAHALPRWGRSSTAIAEPSPDAAVSQQTRF